MEFNKKVLLPVLNRGSIDPWTGCRLADDLFTDDHGNLEISYKGNPVGKVNKLQYLQNLLLADCEIMDEGVALNISSFRIRAIYREKAVEHCPSSQGLVTVARLTGIELEDGF